MSSFSQFYYKLMQSSNLSNFFITPFEDLQLISFFQTLQWQIPVQKPQAIHLFSSVEVFIQGVLKRYRLGFGIIGDLLIVRGSGI